MCSIVNSTTGRNCSVPFTPKLAGTISSFLHTLNINFARLPLRKKFDEIARALLSSSCSPEMYVRALKGQNSRPCTYKVRHYRKSNRHKSELLTRCSADTADGRSPEATGISRTILPRRCACNVTRTRTLNTRKQTLNARHPAKHGVLARKGIQTTHEQRQRRSSVFHLSQRCEFRLLLRLPRRGVI